MTAATSSTLTSLGIATANQVTGVAAGGTTTWGGQTVSGTDTLVRYTYAGDANLSGAINGDDYFLIDQGFAAKANGWSIGDFDYNGRINADDYFIIDRNYSRQAGAFGAALPVAGGVAVVPEPALLELLPIAALLLAARRRRSNPE
jgi:hypothetical protein